MYYDDEDDHPYAPRIGPAAMPSPRSKFAPYFSGCADSLEDFLEEYDSLAYDCALTDPQRVDVLIRYVAPSLRDFWRSLNGYHSRDWPQLRQSLVTIFGNPIPRHQIMKQKLHSHVQDSSRRQTNCEDDVLQYYRQFLCYSAPLVHAGHLSEEERDAAFWYGFHPEDRQVLQPRLLSKNPLQPPDVPFHFEDVFGCARAAFAYDNYFPSPWSQELKFGPSSRCERPVAKHGSRDTYGLREMSRAVTSNAETTSNLDEHPSPSHWTPDSDLPHSLISPSASESQLTQAPSVTVDQPEAAYTLSSTLLPSAYFPTPSHTSSLAHLAADETPEILSTFPSPSITPVPFSIPMSDFEYLPSATVDQPAPTLLSTPPAPSSISSTFLPSPARLETEDHPEPESASTPPIALSSLIHPLTHSPSSPSTDDVPEFAAAPTSSPSISSTFLSSPVRSEMNNQPESEHEAASTSMSVPSLSLPLSTLHPLSPLSSTFLPSLVTSATDDQPEHASTFSIPSSTSFHSDSSLPSTSLLGSPITDNVPEIKPAPLGLSLCPSDLPSHVPTSLAPSPSTSNSQLCFPASSESTPASLSKPLELDDVKLESSPALAPSDVVTLSHPESSLSSLGETIPLLLAQHEASVTVPTPRHSTPPQRPPGFKTVGSDCSTLEVTPAPASLTTPSVPQPRESPLVYYEASLTLAHRFPLTSPPLTLSRSGLARFSFAFVFITTAALVSTLFNASTTLPTLAHKYWSKQEDIGNNRIGTFKTSKSSNTFAHRLRLGQLTPRAPRLVFDPGGPASSFKTTSGTRRHSTMQDDDTRRLQHARHQSSHSHSDRQSHRFRPRRWSIRVRAGTRGFGDA